MKIFFKGTIGLKEALDLLDSNREIAEKHFPRFFMSQIESLRNPKILDKITIEKNSECNYICNVSEGGVFSALWAGLSDLGLGCEVFLRAIPVKQEIVELAELFNENPYEMNSEGSLLFFVDEKKCHEIYENCGIIKHEKYGTLIGYTTDNKDRVIIDGESRRFLTPPARQQKDMANRKAI